MAAGLVAAALGLLLRHGAALRSLQRRKGHGNKVVTIGDSYSAGTGIHTWGEDYDVEFGGFIPPNWTFTVREEADCWRELDTTPGPRYAAAKNMTAVSTACKGALVRNVMTQLDYLNWQNPKDVAHGWNNSVILLTAGGNDFKTGYGLNWPGTLYKCVTQMYCHEDSLNHPVDLDGWELQLGELYTKLATEAPHAKIRIFGYPRLMQRYDSGCWQVYWAQRSECDWMDEMADVVDGHMASAVDRVKQLYPHVDMRHVSIIPWITHGACAWWGDKEVNDQIITPYGASDASFHPTQQGFDRYYEALVDSLK